MERIPPSQHHAHDAWLRPNALETMALELEASHLHLPCLAFCELPFGRPKPCFWLLALSWEQPSQWAMSQKSGKPFSGEQLSPGLDGNSGQLDVSLAFVDLVLDPSIPASRLTPHQKEDAEFFCLHLDHHLEVNLMPCCSKNTSVL